MTGIHVKWAVGLALTDPDGDDDQARGHLQRIDPLLRRAARRKLQGEVEAVLEDSPNTATGRPLLEAVAKRLDVGAGSKAAKPPVWWPTPLVGFLVAVAVAVVVFRVVTAPPPFDPTQIAALPESADAYRTGGRPLSLGTRGEQLFGDGLSGFVVALSRHARKDDDDSKARLDTAQKYLLLPEYKTLIGDKAFTLLSNLAAACRATLIDGEDPIGDVDELNVALADKGLAYYIDSDTMRTRGRTTALLYGYLVERVRLYDVPGHGVERVLWLRRLDKLNLRSNMIGSTHEGSAAAVIRRNLVDTQVMDKLLPMLKSDTAYDLWPLRGVEKRSSQKRDVERIAGEKMRSELMSLVANGKHASKLGELLAKRDELFVQLRVQANAHHVRIRVPKRYRFDMTPFMRLDKLVSRQLLRDLEKLDSALAQSDMGTVYSRVRQAYVRSVELHEIQHRVDDNDTVPPALQAILGVVPEGQKPSAFARRLVTEFSAYLAEIANSDLPVTTYVRLMGFSFDSAQWDSTYADTSLAVTEAIARELKIEYGELVAYGGINREELAKLFLAILQRPRQELKRAARTAYETTFGDKLAEPKLRPLPK